LLKSYDLWSKKLIMMRKKYWICGLFIQIVSFLLYGIVFN
jgi:hypothetical protein